LIEDLAQAMRDASICSLGQTAAAAVQSALAKGLLDAPSPVAAPPPAASGGPARERGGR
jgi:hypothetical protein